MITAENLTMRFGRRRRAIHAVSDVSFKVARGEAVGLVGESGSGKSTIGRLLLGLTKPSAGRVLVDGNDLAAASGAALRLLRQRMQLIFQDPTSSLDPRRRVGAQVADGLAIHRIVPARHRHERMLALLGQVGLDPAHADRYPHSFSGGQLQRIGIARALSTGPDFIVADEPVSALDVSVQAQVLTLLAGLRTRLGLSMLFISHDLQVVRSLCDRVLVLYLGRIVEEGPTKAVMANPRHPYTIALLSASPSIDVAGRRTRIVLAGDPPSPTDVPSGCVFRSRCPWVMAQCADAVPPLRTVGDQHRAACIRDTLDPQAIVSATADPDRRTA